MVLFLASGGSRAHMHQCSAEPSVEALCRALVSSLCAPCLLLCRLWPGSASYLGFPRRPAPRSHLRETAGAPPRFLCPALQARSRLPAVSWGSQQARLLCFPSLRNHCPLFSGVLCLEDHCFLYIVCVFIVPGMRVNLVPFTLSEP